MLIDHRSRYNKQPKTRYTDWIQQQCKAAFKRRRKGEDHTFSTHWLSLWSGFAVAAVSVGLSAVGAWHLLEQQSYNYLHQAKREFIGTPDWDDRVVVIAIDEQSVAQLGRFPWSRDRYTDLLNQLQSAQPAVVAFDILFPESTAQDSLFSEAIAQNANVVLAVGTDSTGRYLNISPSIATRAEGSFLRGDIGNRGDDDGVSRQLPLYGRGGVPSLSVATLQVYAETLAGTTQAGATTSYLPSSASQKLLNTLIPAEAVWLNWPGETAPQQASSSRDLQVYSYADVLNKNVSASLLQNKIVLIGATLAGVDPLRTPFHRDAPANGIHLHAAALNNLLNQSFLRRSTVWQNTLLLIALSLFGIYMLRQQCAYRRLAVIVGFPMLWVSVAFGAFIAGWWIPVAAPVGTILMCAIAVQLHEQREKQELMALFSMNVSPGTAELIWRHKGVILDQGELAAKNLTATVLFMDIRGFTGIAETLPSHQLLPWLNQYFETMTDCIMKHDGMVDKYIGDAIMAVFGAPLPRTRPEEIQADAIAALHAALEMHQRLKSLNQHLAAQNLPTIKFGIGIHTGPLIGGTVGNRHRLNYSLFGDTVNIAARLETMTKSLPEEAPFSLLLSESTCEYTKDHFPVQLVTSGQLRGREGRTDVYTIAASTASAQHTAHVSPPKLSGLEAAAVSG